MMPSGFDELVAQARHDLARMNFPAANWVPAKAGLEPTRYFLPR